MHCSFSLFIFDLHIDLLFIFLLQNHEAEVPYNRIITLLDKLNDGQLMTVLGVDPSFWLITPPPEESSISSLSDDGAQSSETRPYENAITCLRRLPSIQSPFHKFKLLREVFAHINKSIARYWRNNPKKRLKHVLHFTATTL